MARGAASPTPPKGAQGGTMFQLTGSSQYDPAKFYTNGTDSKGHYERMRFKLTPSLQSMAEQIVAGIPDYATVEDLVRDALVHRVVHIQQNMTTMVDERAVRMELHQAEMNRQRSWHAAMDTYLQDCMTTIDSYTEVRDWDGLVDTLSEMEAQVNESGYPEAIVKRLREVIDYGWNTHRTEVTRKQLRASRDIDND